MGGLIGGEAKKISDHKDTGKGLCGDLLERAVIYAMATLETNASMGVIVASPTAGSAGIVPGLLMGVALVIIVMIEAKKHNIQPSREKASAKERWDTFKDAFWGFLMPVIILGGIYGGIFTPTEAAAVSVVYGLFVGMVIYREVKLKDLFDILVDSAKTCSRMSACTVSSSVDLKASTS